MSSVVTAPEGVPSRPPTTPVGQLRGGSLTPDFLLGLLGAVALAVIAFVAAGGNNLAPNTWVQVGLLLVGGAAAIGAVLSGARGRASGAGSLVAFAALAALTYASIAWSVQPANSWLEGNRTLSYFAVFLAAALLAGMAPARWRAMVGAVAAATTVACAYSLLVKVFPGSLDPNDTVGRLQAPLDYWNAVGLMAAIGIPACLWSGARRDASPLLRTVAAPALAILISVLVLSFSRGAVLAAVLGALVWFALAPLRLRSALILAVGAAGGAAIAAWGSAHPGISADNVASAVRISAGHSLGVVVILSLALTSLGGLAGRLALDRVVLTPQMRRRVGTLLIALVALVPLAGLGALAESHRGFTGEISHLWQTLTNTSGGAANQPGRLAQLSNSRPQYWSLAFKIGAHHPLAGTGAGGFGTAQAQYQTGPAWKLQFENVVHAHGYVMETFADLGAIGLAVSLVLLAAWAAATARTLKPAWLSPGRRTPRPPPGPEAPAERAGLIALLAIVATFGLHSLIDWTWFVPGVAVPALAAAGWLAGRGPLSRPAAAPASRRPLSRSPGAVGAIATVVVATLVAVWFVVQPLRSANASSAAYSAALRGDGGTAVADARSAASEDPVSIKPLFLLSQLYTDLRLPAAARAELSDAVHRQPANPQTWEQLGCYDLGRHQTGLAASELHRGWELEPSLTTIVTDPAAFCASIAG